MQHSPDSELLLAVRAGSFAAFDQLYDRHAAAVYRYALKELGGVDDDSAKTITQDVFVRAWEKRHSMTLVDGSIRSWLLRATHFEATRAKAKSARRPVPEGLRVEGPTIPDMVQVEQQWARRVEAHSLIARVDAVLNLMLPLDQQVFHAVVREGATAEEAGARFGLSVPSVRKRLTRVRARLRAELEDNDV